MAAARVSALGARHDSSLTTSDFAAAGGALTSSASQPNAVGQLGEGGAINPLFTFAFSPHRTGCITGWNNKMVTNTGGAEAYVAANVSTYTLPAKYTYDSVADSGYPHGTGVAASLVRPTVNAAGPGVSGPVAGGQMSEFYQNRAINTSLFAVDSMD